MSDVYYKLYKSTRHGMTIVCMQDFDECDYYQDQFVVDIMGRPYQFDNEQDAITRLNQWYKPEQIDPEYRTPNTNDLVR